MFFQIAFAQTNGFRCNFDQFVVFNEFNRVFERQLNRRHEAHRFVGTEPYCTVTSQYNNDMRYWLETPTLPAPPIELVEIERLHREIDKRDRPMAHAVMAVMDAQRAARNDPSVSMREAEMREIYEQECGGTIEPSGTSRIDLIGRNGPTGDHYRAIGQPPSQGDAQDGGE